MQYLHGNYNLENANAQDRTLVPDILNDEAKIEKVKVTPLHNAKAMRNAERIRRLPRRLHEPENLSATEDDEDDDDGRDGDLGGRAEVNWPVAAAATEVFPCSIYLKFKISLNESKKGLNDKFCQTKPEKFNYIDEPPRRDPLDRTNQ